MPRPILRMTASDAGALWRHLLSSGRGTEEVAFLFATFNDTDGGAFNVKEWYPVPPEGFAFCSALHFELSDETRAHVIKHAHNLGASLIELHSHNDPNPPAFSPSDLYGFDEFVPHIWWRLRGKAYAAVVVAPGGLDGIAWLEAPDMPERLAGVEVDGRLRLASHRSVLKWTSEMDGYSHG